MVPADPSSPPSARQNGTYTGAGSINVSGSGIWVTFVRGKERSAADSVQAVLEELVDELYPGAEEQHREAKAALAAEREREAGLDGGADPADVSPATTGGGEYDDELRKELEELRLEREATKVGGVKGKSRRPPSLISAFPSKSPCVS